MMQMRQRDAVRFVLLPHLEQPALLFKSHETTDHLVQSEKPTVLLCLVCRLTVWLGLSSKNKRSMIAQDFGVVIRDLRRSRGLSQERLAESAGLHRTYIGFIERGERTVTIETAQKLAAALGTSLSDVFSNVERLTRPNARAMQEEVRNNSATHLVCQFTCVLITVIDVAQILCFADGGVASGTQSTNVFGTLEPSEGTLLCFKSFEDVILLCSG